MAQFPLFTARRNLDHGVGARFKDHGNDADGTGDAVKAEPFIKLAGKSDFSHGIGKEMICRMPLMLSASFPSSNASRFMRAGASRMLLPRQDRSRWRQIFFFPASRFSIM
ncbi:MAG: hypothetical protein ACLUIQ_10035 [Dialister invisus]